MADSTELGTNSQLSKKELSDLKRYCQSQDDVQPEEWEKDTCKTCGKPTDEKNVDPSSVPETCAVSAVFTIDLILEQIFSTMTQRDLLNCRFVCRRWSVLSSKALQRFNTLTFCQLKEASEFIGWGNPLRPLQHLMYHMNNSLSPKSHFPCTSYVFTFARLNDPPPQLFFKEFGPHITKLKLVQAEGNIYGPILFDDLDTLVLSQMPNLKQLELSGSIAVTGDEKQVASVGSDSNLRYLEFSDIIYKNILEEILSRSSKLIQVELQMKNWNYRVTHRNPLHRFRKITICIEDDSELTQLEDLMNNSRHRKWNVQEVHLDFSDLESSSNTSSRVVNVFNNIVSVCSPSCKKLVWHSFSWSFTGGLIIRPMPNVTHLTLNYTCKKPFFPQSIILETILPNLTDVYFNDMYYFWGKGILITNLFPNKKPVLKVKHVSIVSRLWDNESLRKSFTKMFPSSIFYVRKY